MDFGADFLIGATYFFEFIDKIVVKQCNSKVIFQIDYTS